MVGRIVIDAVRPSTPSGYAAKAVVGEHVTVSADIFTDGHDLLAARVQWRRAGARGWNAAPLEDVGNDRWEGLIVPNENAPFEFRIEAWVDRIATWRHDVQLKAGANLDDPLETEMEEGARFLERALSTIPKERRASWKDAAAALRDTNRSRSERLNAGLDEALYRGIDWAPVAGDATRSRSYPLWVDRPIARAGGWYELFPRSEGGFAGAAKRLPDIADMGFSVVYLPPIHPIGKTFRKGRNNTLIAGPDDPGSPWAIGGDEGGHDAVSPELGTINDFDAFVSEAASNGLEVALDYALQASPDHPWVRDHPEWFHHRPDGTIKYAENPPKKYQDIYPIAFWPENDGDRNALWNACKALLDHWISHGVKIFRVDNPHTKPLAFWEWLIDAVHAEHPDVVFLAEAFTAPKMMAKLAEIGFSQSYTYFTWRTARWELEQYARELALGPAADYMRPNFWPNTPDILSGPLRNGPRSAFQLRYVLAATMSPAWGIYSGYELCENEPISDANEEYLGSEKYEIKTREWSSPNSIAPFITRVNEVRNRHPAFDELRTIRFHETNDDGLIAYSKSAPGTDDLVLVVVNLDPYGMRESVFALDMPALNADWNSTIVVEDELSAGRYEWNAHPYVRLDPAAGQVAHIFRVTR